MAKDWEKRFMRPDTELKGLSDEGQLVRQMMENLHASNALSILQEIQGEIVARQREVRLQAGVTSRHLPSEEKILLNRSVLLLSDAEYTERMKRGEARVAVSLTYNFGVEQVVGEKRIRPGEYEFFYTRARDVLHVTSRPGGRLDIGHLYTRESDGMMKRTFLQEVSSEEWRADGDLVPSLVYGLYEKHPLLLPHQPFQE